MPVAAPDFIPDASASSPDFIPDHQATSPDFIPDAAVPSIRPSKVLTGSRTILPVGDRGAPPEMSHDTQRVLQSHVASENTPLENFVGGARKYTEEFGAAGMKLMEKMSGVSDYGDIANSASHAAQEVPVEGGKAAGLGEVAAGGILNAPAMAVEGAVAPAMAITGAAEGAGRSYLDSDTQRAIGNTVHEHIKAALHAGLGAIAGYFGGKGAEAAGALQGTGERLVGQAYAGGVPAVAQYAGSQAIEGQPITAGGAVNAFGSGAGQQLIMAAPGEIAHAVQPSEPLTGAQNKSFEKDYPVYQPGPSPDFIPEYAVVAPPQTAQERPAATIDLGPAVTPPEAAKAPELAAGGAGIKAGEGAPAESGAGIPTGQVEKPALLNRPVEDAQAPSASPSSVAASGKLPESPEAAPVRPAHIDESVPPSAPPENPIVPQPAAERPAAAPAEQPAPASSTELKIGDTLHAPSTDARMKVTEVHPDWIRAVGSDGRETALERKNLKLWQVKQPSPAPPAEAGGKTTPSDTGRDPNVPNPLLGTDEQGNPIKASQLRLVNREGGAPDAIPDRTQLKVEVERLSNLSDEAYRIARTAKDKADRSGYGTKSKEILERKAQKLDAAAKEAGISHGNAASKLYELNLRDAAEQTENPAMAAAAKFVLATDKRYSGKEQTAQEYRALRDEATTKLKAAIEPMAAKAAESMTDGKGRLSPEKEAEAVRRAVAAFVNTATDSPLQMKDAQTRLAGQIRGERLQLYRQEASEKIAAEKQREGIVASSGGDKVHHLYDFDQIDAEVAKATKAADEHIAADAAKEKAEKQKAAAEKKAVQLSQSAFATKYGDKAMARSVSKAKGFETVTGRPVKIASHPDADLFVHPSLTPGSFTVTEGRSGMALGHGDTEIKAINAAKASLASRSAEDFNAAVESSVKKRGAAPAPDTGAAAPQSAKDVRGGTQPLAKAIGFDQAATEPEAGEHPSLLSTGLEKASAVAHHVADSARRFSGQIVPTITRIGRESGEAVSRFISSPIYVKEAAPAIAEHVLGENGTPEKDALYGTAMVQDNLDSIRDGFIEKARAAEDPEERAALLQKAANVKDIIGAEGSPIKTQAQYDKLLADPEFRATMERYKEWFAGEPDRNYRTAQGIAEDDELPSRGKQTDARVNLIAVNEKDAQPGTTVWTSTRGNLRNPLLKKSPFGRQAFGTGDGYEIRLSKMIENTLGKGSEIARWHEATQQLVKDGVAQIGKPDLNHVIDGKRTVPFDLKRRVLITGGKPIAQNKVLWVRADAAPELRQALNVDSPVYSRTLQGIANVANRTGLTGLTNATYHLANQLSALFHAPSGLIGPTVKRVMQFASSDPQFQRDVAEVARIGGLKSHGPEPTSTLGKIVGAPGKLIQLTDKIGRLVLSDVFDKVAAKGLTEDTETNKRNLINQFGQYNRRGQHRLVALARDLGVGPFATAGTNFYSLGVKALTLSPGTPATSWAAAARMRAPIVGRYGILLGLTALSNYVNFGSVTGGLPFGHLRLPDDGDGKRRSIDVFGKTPLGRGLTEFGARGAIQDMREQVPPSLIIDNAVKTAAKSALSPFEGPLVRDASVAATGYDPRGFDVAGRAAPGESQTGRNLKAMLRTANPVVEGATSDTKSLIGSQLGPFSIRTWNQPEQSNALKAAYRLSQDGVEHPSTPESRARHAVIDSLRSEPDLDKKRQLLIDAVQAGKVPGSKTEIMGAIRESSRSPLVNAVESLRDDPAVLKQVWDVATPAERKELKPLLVLKIFKRSKNLTPAQRQAAAPWLTD